MNNYEYNYNNDFYSIMKSLIINKIFVLLKIVKIWNVCFDDSFWFLELFMELIDCIFYN